MRKYSKCFFSGVLYCLMLCPAWASLPYTKLDRIVKVAEVGSKAEQLLFQMAYAAQPICRSNRSNWTWSFGPLPTTIPLKPQSRDEWVQEIHDTIATHFKLSPGSSLFLADIDQTPWGYAGIKSQEPIRFDLNGDPSTRLLGLLPDSNPAVLMTLDRDNVANPFFEIGIKRGGGQSAALVVRRVPVCKVSLNVVDSIFRYAESNTDEVVVTVPFLEMLSRDELIAVLSHEVSHVAMKSHKGRPTSRLIARFLLGPVLQSAIQFVENHETETAEPQEADLIKADRLAMRLAAGFGVDVTSYVSIMQKLAVEEGSFRSPTYKRTRGVHANRKLELERSAELWRSDKKFYDVDGLTIEIVEELSRLAHQASTDPAGAFGGSGVSRLRNAIGADETTSSASEHSARPNPFGGGIRARYQQDETADLNDVDAVPYISDKGRELYRKYLAAKGPRAFAISAGGASAHSSGNGSADATLGRDPSERAVAKCNGVSKLPCKLYAVEDRVVWDYQTSKRSENSSQALVGLPSAHPKVVSVSSTVQVIGSGFANIRDVDAIPMISDAGRDMYRKFLDIKGPRAFAISTEGAWATALGGSPVDESLSREPSERAVARCNSIWKSQCRLYAVNDVVVWRPEPASTEHYDSAPRASPALRQVPVPNPLAVPVIASGFANIGDIDAIPYIDAQGREKYREWLTKSTPRAIAISPTGTYILSSGTKPADASLPNDPVERAVILCNRVSKSSCTLYAVNGSVVWVGSAVGNASPVTGSNLKVPP